MVYIDKKTFEICSPDSKYYEDENGELLELDTDKIAFECDDLIAPVISILNKKGYTTKYCCQGHYHIGFLHKEDGDNYSVKTYNKHNYDYPYILFDGTYKNLKKNIPSWWTIHYIAKDWRISNDRACNNKPVELNRKIPGVECNMVLRQNITLYDEHIKSILHDDYYISYGRFNLMTAVMMNNLYLWAIHLPNVKIKK